MAFGAEAAMMVKQLEQARVVNAMVKPGSEQRGEAIAVELFVLSDFEPRFQRFVSVRSVAHGDPTEKEVSV